jgi:hypothetical protein
MVCESTTVTAGINPITVITAIILTGTTIIITMATGGKQ